MMRVNYYYKKDEIFIQSGCPSVKGTWEFSRYLNFKDEFFLRKITRGTEIWHEKECNTDISIDETQLIQEFESFIANTPQINDGFEITKIFFSKIQTQLERCFQPKSAIKILNDIKYDIMESQKVRLASSLIYPAENCEQFEQLFSSNLEQVLCAIARNPIAIEQFPLQYVNLLTCEFKSVHQVVLNNPHYSRKIQELVVELDAKIKKRIDIIPLKWDVNQILSKINEMIVKYEGIDPQFISSDLKNIFLESYSRLQKLLLYLENHDSFLAPIPSTPQQVDIEHFQFYFGTKLDFNSIIQILEMLEENGEIIFNKGTTSYCFKRLSLTKLEKEIIISIARLHLQKYKEKLNLANNVTDDAFRIFTNVVEKKLTMGGSIDILLSATIYAALRVHGIPKILEKIRKLEELPTMSIIRSYRQEILPEMRMRVAHITPNQHVDSFIKELKLSMDTRNKAVDLLEQAVKNRMPIEGKDPKGLAAAAIHIATKFTGEPRTQNEIAHVSHITEVTLRMRTKELKVYGIDKEKAPQPPAQPSENLDESIDENDDE